MIDETFFPIELMANDSTLNKIIKNLGMVADKVKEVSSSLVSIKVQGVKLDGKS
jgi:hypothetical protein